MEKSLDRKLADIHANPNSKAFILADAKDADMAFGIASPGRDPLNAAAGFRSLENFRQHIRENIRQGLLDIMLMSASTSYELTIKERAFDRSPMTPAVRMNDVMCPATSSISLRRSFQASASSCSNRRKPGRP